jgi:hypothetical protein
MIPFTVFMLLTSCNILLVGVIFQLLSISVENFIEFKRLREVGDLFKFIVHFCFGVTAITLLLTLIKISLEVVVHV